MADITYLPSQGRHLFLSLVINAYLHKIVGYHVHEGPQAESLVARASATAFVHALVTVQTAAFGCTRLSSPASPASNRTQPLRLGYFFSSLKAERVYLTRYAIYREA